ncbi:MAG TPA: hypothetical protein VKT80_07255, partial [Chloroflexota bacterium]|nr:hypothetical protein [Chloroflexota bacterium]
MREATTGSGAMGYLKQWFGDSDHHELLSSSIENIVDRLHLSYRLKVHDADGWQLVEQSAYADVR